MMRMTLDVASSVLPRGRIILADIFLSYTSTDVDWAFWLAKELEAVGHTAHVHEWEIDAGDDIYAWMEVHHDRADHVLCVVSDDYLKAPYSTLERNAALWQAAKARPGFVLVVVVKPCRLPTLSDFLRRCELFGVPEDAARRRFRDFIAKPAAPATVNFPGQVFAASNIPIRVPEHFMGRDDVLGKVERALDRYQGRVAITALHGLRGVGKTVLAAAYAERHRSDYRAIWWLRAETETGLRADLVGLGTRLRWVAPDQKEEPALATVIERLRHEGDGILLIYDNALTADAIRPYLPRGGGARVLVTSNAPAWRGVAEPVEIRLWPTEIGAEFLIARSGRQDERAAAEALSEALGGLPLAHEQAAAYCERLDLPLVEYHRRFTAAPARLLDDAKDAPAEYHDSLTVAKTFALAIDEAAKLHPAAEPFIVCCALLASEPIPLFLFAEAREHLGGPLAFALADDGLDEAVASLRAFALLDREFIRDERDPAITTDTIRLHRLLSHIAGQRWNEEERGQAIARLITAMATVYPAEVRDDPAVWPRARRLDPLALGLAGSRAAGSRGGELYLAYLLDRLAGYRERVLGAPAQARPLLERALRVCEDALGSDHPWTATSLTNLAGLLQTEGNLTAARPLFERALAIDERIYGSDHPEVATDLNNIAGILQQLGNLATAQSLTERALAIHEKAFGPEHSWTATTLRNLALLLRLRGNLSVARPLCERALAIREKVFGFEHPETAMSLSDLGDLLRDQGDLAGARPFYERAHEVCENVLGHEHPDTAQSLVKLASLLQAEGDLAAARPLLERALRVLEKTSGRGHPDRIAAQEKLAAIPRQPS
jgi:tetratricopeptide (TPR) repeat protein